MEAMEDKVMKPGTVARLLAASVAFALGCSTAPPEPDTAAIDAVLRSAVARGDVAGVVAAAVSPSGLVYHKAFGKRGVARNRDMTFDSIFRIASMTKPVTSVAAMQLYERGAFDLDDAVGKYLPPLAEVQVLDGFDENGRPILRPPATPLTVRHLLTHTSGLGYELWSGPLRDYMKAASVPSALSGGDEFLHVPLLFDPGQRWEYGVNTDWLGKLVETLSGQSLDEYFRQHIFEPLGMSDTHFNLPAEKADRLVTYHHRQADGRLVEAALEPFVARSFFSGGGGLVSTAGDYLRFVEMLLNEGSLGTARILAPETVALMAQNHIGELEAGAMKTVMPALTNDFDFFPAAADRFGLGFLLNRDPVDGGRSQDSLAWAGLYNTYFWIDRERGVGGVLLVQVLPFFDAKAVGLLESFERAVYSVVR